MADLRGIKLRLAKLSIGDLDIIKSYIEARRCALDKVIEQKRIDEVWARTVNWKSGTVVWVCNNDNDRKGNGSALPLGTQLIVVRRQPRKQLIWARNNTKAVSYLCSFSPENNLAHFDLRDVPTDEARQAACLLALKRATAGEKL